MNGEKNQAGTENLERRARAVFDASVDALDGATLSRLNQSRQRALAAAAGEQAGQRLAPRRTWHTWAPAGALAAGVLAAALLLRAPGSDPAQDAAVLATASAPAAVETTAADAAPLEVLAAEDEEFAIATADEDLEFYAWIELAADDAAAGQTG